MDTKQEGVPARRIFKEAGYDVHILAYVVSLSLEVDFVLETVNILIRDYGA